jgi:glycosyltransferase involved in cell wall biosynthesis
MARGIEIDLFSPDRRTRSTGPFRIGYVGRLTSEKNVRFLSTLGKALLNLGCRDFEIAIVGQGIDEAWLRQNVPNAIFTGVLRGEALAQAYANMDLFAFPSTTDTFGNVVLEALASGVPAVVTGEGGPKFLVQSGITGYVARSDSEFISSVAALMANPELHRPMRQAARKYACGLSWDSVFEDVFHAYEDCREMSPHSPPQYRSSEGRALRWISKS